MAMSPEQLARMRARQWSRLQSSLKATPALLGYAQKPLSEYPITDISDVRKDYGRWNSLGLDHDQIIKLAEANERGIVENTNGLSAGYSTGTSGQRGVFLASPSERADYIGQSLARLLPASALLKHQRLALHLRSNNTLYSDVSGKQFVFRHFSLNAPPQETLKSLQAFSPTILIAPPYRLLAMSEFFNGTEAPLGHLKYLFYGSEPMSEVENEHIRSVYGQHAHPIYQATEGFIGGACANGKLHLNDHSMEIELDPVPGTPGYRPIITDLRRKSQPVVRFRGDDYLELDHEVCACDFAGRVIKPIAGRVQNIWSFGQQKITPDQVVSTVESVLGATTPWRAVASASEVIIFLTTRIQDDLNARLCKKLQSALCLPVHVSIHYTKELPNSAKRIKVDWRNV